MDRKRASNWLRRLFPSRLAHIPSEAELIRHRDSLTKAIVMQHAERSVLLGEGRFEIVGDLLAEDDGGPELKLGDRYRPVVALV